MQPDWLTWSRRLQAIAQTGLTYHTSPFDAERYSEVRRIAAEMMAAGAGIADPQPLLAQFAAGEGYATPKVDTRAAVFDAAGRLLLVHERVDGGWTLPGGWADVGDPPSVAAVREVREESGFIVEARKLAAVYDRNLHDHPPFPFHTYKLFFICALIGGEAKQSYETDGVAFFGEHEIPELSLDRVMPSQIAHMFEHYRNPELPTSFD